MQMHQGQMRCCGPLLTPSTSASLGIPRKTTLILNQRPCLQHATRKRSTLTCILLVDLEQQLNALYSCHTITRPVQLHTSVDRNCSQYSIRPVPQHHGCQQQSPH